MAGEEGKEEETAEQGEANEAVQEEKEKAQESPAKHSTRSKGRKKGWKSVQEASFYTPRRATANKLLAKRWDEETQQIHEQKLQHIQPQIDTQSPPNLPHLRRNPKGLQLRMEQADRINRDNMILHDKLKRIDRHGANKPLAGTVGARQFGQASRPFNLNEPAKRAQRRKIEEENKHLKQRIDYQRHSRRSPLSPADLEKEWQRTMEYRKLASQHWH